MSKAVRSDGSNQKAFEHFISVFDTISDAEVRKAQAYFEERKDNCRPRLDDITLEALVICAAKFYNRYHKCPNQLKKYMYIKLLQGKAAWDRDQADQDNATKKHPWS